MFGPDFVSFDFPAAGFGIDGVEVEAVCAGDEAHGLVGVGSKFARCASLARIIARNCQTSVESGVRIFESADVVSLPAVKRHGNAAKLVDGGVGVYSVLPVNLFGE